jgi:ABC-type antimicrobial peptide transport system permease subunit
MKRLFVVLAIFVALSIAGLAIASPSMQGAFPQTGILDDFNRADEGPPPSLSWASIEETNGLVVLSNQLAGDPAGSGGGIALWLAETDQDCEVYFTVVTRPGESANVSLYARNNISASYELLISRSDVDGDYVELYATGDLLETYFIDWQDGDSFGMQLVGSTIVSYYRPVGGNWDPLGTIVDASNLAGGYLAVSMYDNTARIDGFGGGDITELSPTPTPTATITPSVGITTTIPVVVVPIPGGQAQPAIYVIYSLTIGEIILAAVILLLVLVIVGRWLYDVAMDVFQVRNSAIGSWVSRKLYKRWINRMVE